MNNFRPIVLEYLGGFGVSMSVLVLFSGTIVQFNCKYKKKKTKPKPKHAWKLFHCGIFAGRTIQRTKKPVVPSPAFVWLEKASSRVHPSLVLVCISVTVSLEKPLCFLHSCCHGPLFPLSSKQFFFLPSYEAIPCKLTLQRSLLSFLCEAALMWKLILHHATLFFLFSGKCCLLLLSARSGFRQKQDVVPWGCAIGSMALLLLEKHWGCTVGCGMQMLSSGKVIMVYSSHCSFLKCNYWSYCSVCW